MIKIIKSPVLLSLCIVYLFTSCNLTTGGDKVKIALMLPTLKISRFEKDKEYFLAEAQKLGCEGIVVEADNNEVLQLQQAEELMNQGVKAIVIAAVNSNTGAVMVRNAKAKGIKTIAYDGILGNCPLDYMISFDNEMIGKMMASYALTKVQSGNFIIIGGDKINLNSIQIRNGEEEVLAPYLKDGRIKIAFADYAEGWNADDANMMVKRYLKLTSGDMPTAVLGANDNIADGIIRAFEEQGMTVPVVTGQDAALLGCQNIMKGKQSMTVYKPIKNLATKAAQVAQLCALGKKIEGVTTTTWNGVYDIPTIIIDMISVDKNNMETTVIADGFQKKEEVMK